MLIRRPDLMASIYTRSSEVVLAAKIDELLSRAREQLDRVPAGELADEVARGAVVVDIRPVELRLRDGEMPGALVIDRNVLLWLLDPTCADRCVDIAPDQRVILFCDESYASSLAALEVQKLGLAATDIIGGYQAWLALQGS